MPQQVTLASQGTAKYAAVTVGTGAVLLTAGTNPTGGKQDMSSVGDRKNITIFNNGTATIYIGSDSSVTTATGLPIPAGSQYSADYGSKVTVYGISGSAGQDVRVLEAY